jgi:hypothetical protein
VKTYRKLGEYQHCQSSWTPRFLPCQDHQFQNGRRQCAVLILAIINARITFQTYANDALRTDQLDELVGGCALAIALGISLEVSEITYMANLIGGGTMSLGVRVDY